MPNPGLQLTTDIETGFNQRKPPHRTVCVAIYITAAFDTVSHDTLISKVAGSSLPPAITRWLSCYLRGRQPATSFRGTKSSTRIVRTGVPQRSMLSLSLFNYYISDMPRPTTPVAEVNSHGLNPGKHQFQMHPDITLEDTQLPLERNPKILGVIMDPSYHSTGTATMCQIGSIREIIC